MRPIIEGRDSARVFDVFNPAGLYLGRVTSDVDIADKWTQPDQSPLRPLIIRGDHLWAITTDSLDVLYVVRAVIDGRN